MESVKSTHNTAEYSKRKWQRPLKAATHDVSKVERAMGYGRDIEVWMNDIIDLRSVEIGIITNRVNAIRVYDGWI